MFRRVISNKILGSKVGLVVENLLNFNIQFYWVHPMVYHQGKIKRLYNRNHYNKASVQGKILTIVIFLRILTQNPSKGWNRKLKEVHSEHFLLYRKNSIFFSENTFFTFCETGNPKMQKNSLGPINYRILSFCCRTNLYSVNGV